MELVAGVVDPAEQLGQEGLDPRKMPVDFVFGFEPYYAVYADQPERLLGLSPLTDQKLAGVVMMAEQTVTLGLAIVLLVRGARRARATHGATPEPV